jgi:hypothetical protein
MPRIGPLSPASEEELELARNRWLEVVINWVKALEEFEAQGQFRELLLHRILEGAQDVELIQGLGLVRLGNVLSISGQSQIPQA